MKRIMKKLIMAVISVMITLSIMPYYSAFADAGGSIEITSTATNTADKRTVPGVKLCLYKIADTDDAEECGYKITDSFIESGVKSTDIVYTDQPSDIAGVLEKFAAEHSINPQTVGTSDNNGYLKFTGLEDGIYLIRQINTDDEFKKLGYKYSTEAYIVAIPSLDFEGNHIRNVSCQPKGTLTEIRKNDTSLTVYKVWKDDNDKKGDRPKTIEVGLYKDGALKEKIELSAGNNWMYAWDNLDEDGRWSVKEIDVPGGYVSSVSNNDQEWTITNTHKPDNTTSVKTGDNADTSLWLGILIIAVSILASAAIYNFRQGRNGKS